MFQRLFSPLCDIIAKRLLPSSVTANEVTLSGWICAIWAWVMLAHGHAEIALGLFLLNRFLDGLDGAVARLKGPTAIGRYLDIICDHATYLGMFISFVIYRPDHAFTILMVVAVYCFYALTRFVALIFIEKNLSEQDTRQYRLGRFMNGSEEFFMVVLMCFAPNFTLITGLVYSMLAFCATLSRILTVKRIFSQLGLK